MHWSYGPGFREYVSRTARGLGVLALTIAFMLSAASAAFAASSSITDLASSTHPDDAWRSSDDASFAWRQKTDYNPSIVGRFASASSGGVTVVGEFAYLTDQLGLSILDVSDPSAPTLISRLQLSAASWYQDVTVSGDLAYVVANGRTIAVDISDPEHPVERGHFASSLPMEVTAVGSTVFIADNNARQLYVVDASNPDDLKLLGNCGVGNSWGMSSVVDGRIAVASASQITLVDVSDAARPTPIGSVGAISRDVYLYDVEISGNTMYAASEWTGLMVYDITDPAHPANIATAPMPLKAMSVKVSGDRAYVVDTYGGLFTFDVSNRLAPVLKGKPVHLVGGQALAVQGRFAYIATAIGLDIIDVWSPPAVAATPAALLPSNRYECGGAAATADRLYVPRWDSGFDIFNVTSPATPVKLGSFDTSGSASAIAVKGDYAFVLDGMKGLKSFDVSNPATPKIVGELTGVRGGASGDQLMVAGNTLIVQSYLDYGYPTPSYTYRISIIDITDPRSPSVAQRIYGGYNDIDVSGDLLYAVAPWVGVHVIDISRPESSTIIAGIPRANSSGVVTGVAVDGDSLFVAGVGMGVTKYDISDPRHPVGLGFYQGSGSPVGLDAVGDTLYVASRGYGLDVVDFSDSKNPASLGRCDTPGDAYRVEVVGTTAYVGDTGSVAIIPGLPRPKVEYSWDISSDPTSVPDVTAEGSGRRVSLAGLADGEHYFKVRAVLDGVAQATQTKLVRIDTTAPSTEASVSAQGAGASREVTLTADDVHSGVKTTWYRLGSGGKTLYEGPIEVRGSNARISYWSEDVAGNIEDVQYVDVTIDATAPTLTHDAAEGWVTHPVDVTLVATDTSGVNSVDWTLTGAESATGTAKAASTTVRIGAQGETAIAASATDEFGNRSETVSIPVRIDTAAPSVTLTEDGSLGYLARYALTGSDALSGVTLNWRIDGGAVQYAQASSKVVTCEVDGSHTIEAWATDGAGNESAHMSDSFQVDVPLAALTVAGSDRFATAVEVSKQAFPRGANTVVLATGMNWPDALGGSALAGALDAPVLLVTPDAVPAVTAAEIKRLGATNAIILGGTNAVSAKAQGALSALVSGDVQRIGGANRYRTAELVAARSRVELGADFDGTVFVASGTDYADAVAAGPMAARHGWPLYLAETGRGLAPETKAALGGAKRAVVLGGTSDVAAAAATDLSALLGSAKVERVAGQDRYGDVLAIAKYAVAEAGFGWDRIGIATGENFPDSLTGGLLQAKANSVMVLTPAESLYAPIGTTIRTNSAQIRSVTFFGGLNAVGRDVRDAVSGARN